MFGDFLCHMLSSATDIFPFMSIKQPTNMYRLRIGYQLQGIAKLVKTPALLHNIINGILVIGNMFTDILKGFCDISCLLDKHLCLA